MTLLVSTAAQAAAESHDAASWLSYAAVAVAALSVAVSLVLGRSNRATAKRALALSERQEARRDTRIDLYLNESVSWRGRPGSNRVLGFHILISNPTDRANSLVDAELHLTYDLAGVVTTLKVGHTDASVPPPAGVSPLSLPTRLDANEATSGWLFFQVSQALAGDREIDRYDLVLRDIHGLEETRQVTIFREAADEQTD
jgi:hypothetical protein